MRKWTAKVDTFNGRYWRTNIVKVEASSLSVASARGIQTAIRSLPRRQRVEEVIVRVTPIKAVVFKDIPEEVEDGGFQSDQAAH